MNATPLPVRIAILDMYQNMYNQGLSCILKLLASIERKTHSVFDIRKFDVRSDGQVPGLDFDIYLSTGGPGSPMETNEPWESAYENWLQSLLTHNQAAEVSKRKFAFFICHSFQLACRILHIGHLSPSAHKIEGIFPVRQTDVGASDVLFHALENPFWALDSRSFQVTQVNVSKLSRLGGQILALEHSNSTEPAIMAIRFSEEMIGTQFHPEADADGWMIYVENKIRTDIEQQAAWKSALERALIHHKALQQTHQTLLPGFLKQAIQQIR